MKCSNRVMSMETSPVRKLIPYANKAKTQGKKVFSLKYRTTRRENSFALL